MRRDLPIESTMFQVDEFFEINKFRSGEIFLSPVEDAQCDGAVKSAATGTSKGKAYGTPYILPVVIDRSAFMFFQVMMESSEACNFFYRLRANETGLIKQKYYV